MTSLQLKYSGAQDVYFTPKELEPLTFESEYLDTKTRTVSWEKIDIKDLFSDKVRSEYRRICALLEENPQEYAEEYVAMKRKYQEESIWELLVHTNNPVKNTNIVTLDFLQEGGVGFTGLQFVGDPSAVESIALEIGRHTFDTIYPSITGQFDPIHLFDTVVPSLVYNVIRLRITFLKENIPLEVSYDRVLCKGDVNKYTAFYKSTQHTDSEDVKKGKGIIYLNYNHPVESIRLLSKARLTKVVLDLDDCHTLHVPAKGLQNGMYCYEISFNGLINFSRIESVSLKFKAEEDTTVYAFAKSHNVARFMGGMAEILFSR